MFIYLFMYFFIYLYLKHQRSFKASRHLNWRYCTIFGTIRPYVPIRQKPERETMGDLFDSKYIYKYLLYSYWLVVWNIFVFHNIWDNPSHWHIFQRGRSTTNQIMAIVPEMATDSQAKSFHVELEFLASVGKTFAKINFQEPMSMQLWMHYDALDWMNGMVWVL